MDYLPGTSVDTKFYYRDSYRSVLYFSPFYVKTFFFVSVKNACLMHTRAGEGHHGLSSSPEWGTVMGIGHSLGLPRPSPGVYANTSCNSEQDVTTTQSIL